MKSPLKIFPQDYRLPILYETYEEEMIAHHNFDGSREDCQDSSDEDTLLENYTSSNGLEMEYEEDGNPSRAPKSNIFSIFYHFPVFPKY